MILRFFFSLLLYSLLSACSTTSPPLDKSPSDDCVGLSLAAQDICQQQRYKSIDARLNQTYKILRQQLNPKQAKALRQAQRLWLPYRDLHCEQAIAEQQAHLQSSLKYRCLGQLSQQRVNALRRYQAPVQQSTRLNYMQIDQRLNQLYQAQMKAFSQPQQQRLRQAQRAWLAFRDAECAAQQRLNITKNNCLARLTLKRNQQLQNPLLATNSANTAMREETLLGRWQRLNYKGNLQLNFGVRNGVHYYASQLEQLPHEAGQWQFKQGQLKITDSRGRLLYAYQVLNLTNGILSLQQIDGTVVRYKKLTP